ncbi:IS3 family transposase [Parvimonas sp. D9]|uniref:IS3 family transposase n=1 Tax=Parvimonas sp. D9 TaxID=3110689 RepID=UPI002B4676CE|nr:IS3 family transposase [Parvimonas sp. D9]
MLKQEMFYEQNYSSYKKLIENIKEYIKWYNTKRIKENLKGMSPIDYRLHSFK